MTLGIPHHYTSLVKEELDSSEVVPSRGSANVNSKTQYWRIQVSLPLLLALLLLLFSLGAIVATLFAHFSGTQSRQLRCPINGAVLRRGRKLLYSPQYHIHRTLNSLALGTIDWTLTPEQYFYQYRNFCCLTTA